MWAVNKSEHRSQSPSRDHGLLEPSSGAELPDSPAPRGRAVHSRDRLAPFLSKNTIRSRTHPLHDEVGVHGRVDAVARATALGLLEQMQSPM
jgi:hypothetical protein